MKYTKTAAALALAGFVAMPMAQADVTLTGYLGIGLVGSDADGDAGNLNMFSDDSTINVRASQTLDNGLEGYANYRTDFGLANGGGGDGDNIHLGIKGDFGDIRIGEVPDAIEYGQVANDILSDIGGEERGISYTGTFGSATIGVNVSPEGLLAGDKLGGGSDRIGAGIKFSAGGFGIGLGFGTVGDDSRMSAGATFGLGGASIGVAFKDFDNDRSTISAKGSYSIGKATLALSYEAEAGDVNDGDNKIRFDASYSLGGAMTISTRFNAFTDDSDSSGDVSDYRVLLSKDF